MSQRLSAKTRLTALDRRILNRLQEDIPFVQNPWEVVARKLDISEHYLLQRVRIFKRKGIIRRISGVFSPRKVNYVSTLVAVRTSPRKSSAVAKRINVYPEVTHNYRRDAHYNIWFALVAKDKKRISSIIRRIARDKDVQQITEFPTEKLFKINVKLPI